VVRSLGKTLGLNGVRLGYQVANPALSQKIGTTLPKWNLNCLAEMVVFMLAEHWDEYAESLKLVVRDRFMMSAELGRFPELTVYSSQASFLLIRLPAGVNGGELAAYLLSEHHILVRECGTRIGMTGGFIRVSVRPEDDVDRLVEGLRGFARSGSAVELVAQADERAFG
jgi:histidinol-phosphate/aromatic aminotransferase/cobyric acid decarboxylase-like protein